MTSLYMDNFLPQCVSGITTPSCLVLFHPGRGESGKDGEKSVVRQEKGFLQKLKDVFWKEEEEDDSNTRQKQKMN